MNALRQPSVIPPGARIEMSRTSNRSGHPIVHVSDNLFAVLLIVPALLVMGTVVLLPMLKGIAVSFSAYGLANMHNPTWNNFQNYIKLFQKGEVFTYFGNTLVYVGISVSTQFLMGLMIALLLNTKIVGRSVLRGLMMMPWVIPSVVVAIVWRWMLQPQYGVLNYILYHLGLSSTVNIAWTQHPVLAMISVSMAAIWRQLPYMMVMILAALQAMDQTIVEAAKIDGANPLQMLIRVTLPSIRPVIATSIWISVMQNFQMFTIIWNMTGGGPVTSTTTLSVAVYRKAFLEYNFGVGSALGVLWLLVLFVATLVYNRINDRLTEENQ